VYAILARVDVDSGQKSRNALDGVDCAFVARGIVAEPETESMFVAYDDHVAEAPIRIALHKQSDAGYLTLVVVQDNLVKGAAGQAIQNMNIMFDLPEHTGLAVVPLLP
jgi:N-acetyl-gamma-glutamylphosphate reductase